MAALLIANQDVPTYGQVISHHAMAREAIGLFFSNLNQEYADLPIAEVESRRIRAVKTQELRDMMAPLAFLEACFKLDYASRKRLKLKDRLSKTLIKLFNQKKNKARLMEDIIKSWQQEGFLSHQEYDRINSAFKLRHWIAHGQYWSPDRIRAHDFIEVAEFIEGLINSRAFESGGIDLVGD
ncbi:hypothetical protein [Stenotrophomonas sp. SORGH_AS_0321]|uniref:hypothetical protein n=1 Tax=Stenotrophomonas sp. SORGH_AS_0321 TaxID=3041787 RepID=UPI002864F196|nr:hypothetical protein [Stenotrophomonas sp. SORGH_AS_0321]MDR6094433.1 hypothetical protein [Stenotrophomonas sp. SORGH_AS_0321]